MNYDYRIVNKKVWLETEYPLINNWESELFEGKFQEQLVDFKCQIFGVANLPEAKGKLILQTDDRMLYLHKDMLYQKIINRKNKQPIFLAEYAVNDSSDVRVWSWDREYPYTARMEHIWAAMDLPYQLLKEKILVMHSAVVKVNGEAVLFIAPSGIGKSTQARLWNETRGAEQLNGDKTAICIEDGQVFTYGLPFSGTSKICSNYKLPVRAIVILSQGSENRVESLSGIKAISAMIKNCFGHTEVPGCVPHILDILGRVVPCVSMYSLACTPDERAVEALEKVLWKR